MQATSTVIKKMEIYQVFESKTRKKKNMPMKTMINHLGDGQVIIQ